MPLVYDELRRLAASYLRRERPGQTLQATALVHEAYVRLISERAHNWQNRTHFLAIAALSMRQILVQRARAAERRQARRRPGPHHARRESARRRRPRRSRRDRSRGARRGARAARGENERQAKIVELRYFGGLSVEESAEALDISPATVKRDWTVARAWLKRALEPGSRQRSDSPRAAHERSRRAHRSPVCARARPAGRLARGVHRAPRRKTTTSRTKCGRCWQPTTTPATSSQGSAASRRSRSRCSRRERRSGSTASSGCSAAAAWASSTKRATRG